MIKRLLITILFLLLSFVYNYAETATFTPTITPTITSTITKTSTKTHTRTISPTKTRTPLNTRTFTRTITLTRTKTLTITITSTWTATKTITQTSTITETFTITQTPTILPTIITGWQLVSQNNNVVSKKNSSIIVFDSKIWNVAGYYDYSGTTPTKNYLNDVWSTVDGVTWSTATAQSQFYPRQYNTINSYQNYMWIIGGEVFDGGFIRLSNDIWRNASSSSQAWVKITNARFSARKQHSTLEFNNKIWVIGGYNGSAGISDVWSSSNMSSWDYITNSASFGKRYNHICLNYNGKMWIIGGIIDSVTKNDVWNSSDGITWTQVASTTNLDANAFLPSGHYSGLVYNNRMWVIGGVNGQSRKVWNSVDGYHWYQVTTNNFSKQSYFDCIIYDDKIWMINTQKSKDIWKSTP